MSDFFVVDFSKYHDLWEKNSSVEPNGNGAEPTRPDPLEGWEDDPPFIPEAWQDAAFDMDVERRVRSLFVDEKAQRRKREIQAGKLEDPPIFLVTDFLAQPDNPARYVIHDLWPVGGNVLFAAPAKFGKSSVTMNLIRSLVDGTGFLSHFAITDTLQEGENTPRH